MALSDDDLARLGRCVELATVYTSGEHCPMCAAGHAWVGSRSHRVRRVGGAADPLAVRMERTLTAGGAPADHDGRPAVVVDGPAPELSDAMKSLYEAKFRP